MQKTKRKKRLSHSPLTLILIFICVGLAFYLCTLAAQMLSETRAAAETENEAETMSQQEDPVSPMQTALDLPRNDYDASLFYTENGYTKYSGAETTYTGIDISEHQGEIDWAAVKADGVDYAIIRVGYRGYAEGEINTDVRAAENIRGALDAGIAVGAYFFSQAITEDEAREEAQFVIDVLAGYDITCPVAFDWEPIEAEARTDGMDSVTLTGIAEAYCQAVEDAGYRAAIYFNQAYGYQELNLPMLKSYVFWLAEYNSTPSFVDDFQMWQYTNDGTVAGINEKVDLNLYFAG